MCYPMRIPQNDGRLPVPLNLYPGKVYNVDALITHGPSSAVIDNKMAFALQSKGSHVEKRVSKSVNEQKRSN